MSGMFIVCITCSVCKFQCFLESVFDLHLWHFDCTEPDTAACVPRAIKIQCPPAQYRPFHCAVLAQMQISAQACQQDNWLQHLAHLQHEILNNLVHLYYLTMFKITYTSKGACIFNSWSRIINVVGHQSFKTAVQIYVKVIVIGGSDAQGNFGHDGTRTVTLSCDCIW